MRIELAAGHIRVRAKAADVRSDLVHQQNINEPEWQTAEKTA
jgi:hypothetical protein